MKKILKNVCLIVCTACVLTLVPLFLSHDVPIQVEIPRLDATELAAQKEAAAKAEKEAVRRARINKVFSCQTDEDCIIVDKDPCGCAAGPKGVVAINVNFITEFNALNQSNAVTKACDDVLSQQRECSPSAKAVCKARSCKIVY